MDGDGVQHLCSLANLLADERRGVLASRASISSPSITPKMRPISVDWLLQVHKMFKLRGETFCAAVNILDAFLARDATLLHVDLQLATIACLSLAAGYYEIYAPEMNDYVFIIDKERTQKEIEEMAARIFVCLGCNINIAEEMRYLRAVSIESNAGIQSFAMGKCLLTMITITGSDFLPSVVVSAVRKIAAQAHDETYVNYFGIPDDVVAICVDEIIKLCGRMHSSSLKAFMDVHRCYRAEWDKFFPIVCAMIPTTSPSSPSSIVVYRKDHYFRRCLEVDLLSPEVIPRKSPKLGQGTFSVVKRVEYQNQPYAVKRTKTDAFWGGSDQMTREFVREVSMLQTLDHPHVAKPRHITSDLRSIFFDVGICDLTKLHADSDIRVSTCSDLQFALAHQMFSALAYIHSMGCLHRDVKPHNIIVYPPVEAPGPPRFVLSDFGSGRGCQIPLRENNFTTYVCTLHYRPPELLLGANTYTDVIDVWGMLCTLYEFATGQVLFPGDSEIDQMFRIFRYLGTPTDGDVDPTISVLDSRYWPGVSKMTNYEKNFPRWAGGRVIRFDAQSSLSPMTRDLLVTGLILDPSRRPRANKLLQKLQQRIEVIR